jgi:hypothetical protein
MDLFAFNNRLSATIEYYTDITSNVLQKEYKIPASTGYEYLKYFNDGKIENSGFETQLHGNILRMENVNFSLDFNFSINKNKIIEVPENILEDDVNMLANGNYATNIVQGGAVHSYFGYIYDGVFATDEDALAKDENGNTLVDPWGNALYLRHDDATGYIFKGGDAKYRDINYDGLINEYDVVQLGKPYPDFHGGFGGTLILFKDITLNASFHYKVGHDIVNETKMNLENMHSKSNQAVSVNRRWRKQGDITDMPRALYNLGYNYLGSSRFVEDGSFLKLRFVSVAYNLPDKWLSKIFVKDMNVFFTMYNLYTWTDYTGQNPEVSVATKNIRYIGKDDSKTPPSRDISFGVNVKF